MSPGTVHRMDSSVASFLCCLHKHSLETLPPIPLMNACEKTHICVKPKSFPVIIHEEATAQAIWWDQLHSVGPPWTTRDSQMLWGQICSVRTQFWGRSSCWQSWSLGPPLCQLLWICTFWQTCIPTILFCLTCCSPSVVFPSRSELAGPPVTAA